MISFACDVCGEACRSGGESVLIERNSTMVRDGVWLKGIKIMTWDDEVAGSGRYHHVHLDQCLAGWITRDSAAALLNALDPRPQRPQLQKRSARK